jgi:uncharacterized protein (DUF433 family)
MAAYNNAAYPLNMRSEAFDIAEIDEIVRSDPEILGGTPVFKGTRVPVQSLFDYLEGGETLDEFLRQFPSVTRRQAVATLDLRSPGRHVGSTSPPDLNDPCLGPAPLSRNRSLLPATLSARHVGWPPRVLAAPPNPGDTVALDTELTSRLRCKND